MATLGMNRNVDGVPTSADSASISIYNWPGYPRCRTHHGFPHISRRVLVRCRPLLPETTPPSGRSLSPASLTTISPVRSPVVLPVANIRGITLAELERAVARRVGPFWQLRAFDTGSSVSKAIVKKLRSSMDIGDYEDMYMLRRGVYSSGLLVANFRTRMTDSPWIPTPTPMEG